MQNGHLASDNHLKLPSYVHNSLMDELSTAVIYFGEKISFLLSIVKEFSFSVQTTLITTCSLLAVYNLLRKILCDNIDRTLNISHN